MTTIYKYRVYCTSDTKYEYSWGETAPSDCPTNTAHGIDYSKTTIVETNAPNETRILEETVPTGGNFCISMSKVIATDGETSFTDWSKPFPISALSLFFIASTDHCGDCVEVLVGPNTVVGAIGANVTASDTVITVGQTVIDNIRIGFHAGLNDGTNSEDLGYVVAIDDVNNQITVENNAVNAYLASTPTYVNMTAKTVDNLEISMPGKYEIGGDKIGGAHIPANTTVRTCYTNHGDHVKTFIGYVEYLY